MFDHVSAASCRATVTAVDPRRRLRRYWRKATAYPASAAPQTRAPQGPRDLHRLGIATCSVRGMSRELAGGTRRWKPVGRLTSRPAGTCGADRVQPAYDRYVATIGGCSGPASDPTSAPRIAVGAADNARSGSAILLYPQSAACFVVIRFARDFHQRNRTLWVHKGIFTGLGQGATP